MGLVTNDDLGITTGLFPVAALLGFSGCERMFVIVPFVLDEDFVGTGATHLSCERVMEMFFLGDRDFVHTLFGGFLEGSSYFAEPELCSTMSHNNKGNN